MGKNIVRPHYSYAASVATGIVHLRIAVMHLFANCKLLTFALHNIFEFLLFTFEFVTCQNTAMRRQCAH